MWCILHPVVLGCFYRKHIKHKTQPSTTLFCFPAPFLVHECYRYRSGVSPFFRDSSSKNHAFFDWQLKNFAFFDRKFSVQKRSHFEVKPKISFTRGPTIFSAEVLSNQIDKDTGSVVIGERGRFFFSIQYGLCWQNLILKPNRSRITPEKEQHQYLWYLWLVNLSAY